MWKELRTEDLTGGYDRDSCDKSSSDQGDRVQDGYGQGRQQPGQPRLRLLLPRIPALIGGSGQAPGVVHDDTFTPALDLLLQTLQALAEMVKV